MWRKNEKIGKTDENCPLCGRLLWVPLVVNAGKRYCENCDQEFEVSDDEC